MTAPLVSILSLTCPGPGNESDGAWMHAVTRGWKSWDWLPPNFAWLVHDANTVIRPRENPLKSVLSPGDAIAVYGAQAWGDTSERIVALRDEAARAAAAEADALLRRQYSARLLPSEMEGGGPFKQLLNFGRGGA